MQKHLAVPPEAKEADQDDVEILREHLAFQQDVSRENGIHIAEQCGRVFQYASALSTIVSRAGFQDSRMAS